MSGFAFVRNVWFWILYEMSCVRNVVCTNCRAPGNPYLVIKQPLIHFIFRFLFRGSDIEFNPVFFAFSIVTSHDVYLFVDSEKLDQATVEHLKGAQIKPYEDIVPLLKNLASECVSNGGFIWMATQTNHALANEVLKIDKRKLILKNTPVKQFKAVKNEVEIQVSNN